MSDINTKTKYKFIYSPRELGIDDVLVALGVAKFYSEHGGRRWYHYYPHMS